MVIATTAPSGVTLFSATDAAEKPRFCFNAPEYEQLTAYYSWRILIQVVAVQMSEFHNPYNHPGDEIKWQERIQNTLERVNQKGRMFRPQSIPSDIVPPTAVYRALSVTGNWCETLTDQLSSMFLNVPNADTLKIELFQPDAVPPRKDDTASIYNLPVLLGADNTIIS